MRAAKDRSYIGLDCDNTRADNPCGIGKQPRRASPFSYAVARASSRRNYRECDSRLAFSHSVQAAPELSSLPLSLALAALSHLPSLSPSFSLSLARARALIISCEFVSSDKAGLNYFVPMLKLFGSDSLKLDSAVDVRELYNQSGMIKILQDRSRKFSKLRLSQAFRVLSELLRVKTLRES